MKLKKCFLFCMFAVSVSQSFGQKKLLDGIFIKAGIKGEKISWDDQRLLLPEAEIGKRWNDKWLTSFDFSSASNSGVRFESKTYCADLNVFYSAFTIGRNILRAGTGMSYRYLESDNLVGYRMDGDGNVTDMQFEHRKLRGMGANIMLEDEFRIYKGIVLSGRAGYQYYGRDMRSYMASVKLGYVF